MIDANQIPYLKRNDHLLLSDLCSLKSESLTQERATPRRLPTLRLAPASTWKQLKLYAKTLLRSLAFKAEEHTSNCSIIQ